MIGMLRAAAVAADAPQSYAVSVTAQGIYAFETFPDNATARYWLGLNGIAYRDIGGIGPVPIAGQWLNPADSTAAALYEARVTVVSGALSSGTVGTWVSLDEDRSWSRTRMVVGTTVCVILVEIRLIGGDGTILSSANITLSAEVDSGD